MPYHEYRAVGLHSDLCQVCGEGPYDEYHSANKHQVGGGHYRSEIQHWDYVWANNLDYFQGQITKYVSRWKEKGGVQDLKKARHFLDKYIELQEASQPDDGSDAGPGYVNQDR